MHVARYMRSTAIQEPIFKPGKIHHGKVRDEERFARGKAARADVPRSRHAELHTENRRDPIELLEAQGRIRVAELLPIRYGRMMVSPFTFFRGAAIVMASDLGAGPISGLRAQLCGDAHLLNFGMFGTPERELVFDVNDFDETLPGPWEWDIKRLVTSIDIAGRGNGFTKHDRHTNVREAVRCYRETMAELATMNNLDVWYARLDAQMVVDTFAKQLTRRERHLTLAEVAKSEVQDSVRELAKLTEIHDGKRRIISKPPLIVPLREILGEAGTSAADAATEAMIRLYAESLPGSRRVLLDQYRLVEVARKVVGVGSVGTRCWIALFAGVDDNDPLFLQVKEADPSVLEPYAGPSIFPHSGQRVVMGQKLMQAASDLLLGWAHVTGLDGVQRDFYVRQLRDWKSSVPVDDLLPEGMSLYGRMCAWSLARAHARSGDRVAIAGYLGKSERFDDAMVTFATAYADQNEQDHARLVQCVRSKRLPARAAA